MLGVVGLAVAGALLLYSARQPRSPAGPVALPPARATGSLPELVVYHSPTCECCGRYTEYLVASGFAVRIIKTDRVADIKQRYRVPRHLASCHTVVADGYFVEGHVPVEAVARLLRDRPAVAGIALPGMPPGSPGMGGVRTGPLVVYAASERGISAFARF